MKTAYLATANRGIRQRPKRQEHQGSTAQSPGASRGERHHRGRAGVSQDGDAHMTISLTLDYQTFWLLVGLFVCYLKLRK
nr:MAG TPA: hypothetical protein [Caudoviricetes sp.]